MGALAGPALALLSALAWGSADFAGGLLARRVRPVVVVACSQAAGLLLAVVAAAATGAPRAAPGPWLWWGPAAALSGSGGLVLFYAALARGRMGVVSPVAALGAVVPVALAAASGERPSALQVAGVAVALAGGVAASGPELRRPARRADGGPGGAPATPAGRGPVVLAAASGVGFGLALWCIARGSASSAVLTLLVMRAVSVAALGAVVVGLVRGERRAGRPAGLPTRRELPLVAACGVLDAGANLLLGVATTLGLVAVTTALGSLYPVATALLARWVLAERLAPVQVAGVGAALAGVALVAAG